MAEAPFKVNIGIAVIAVSPQIRAEPYVCSWDDYRVAGSPSEANATVFRQAPMLHGGGGAVFLASDSLGRSGLKGSEES